MPQTLSKTFVIVIQGIQIRTNRDGDSVSALNKWGRGLSYQKKNKDIFFCSEPKLLDKKV